MLINNVNLFLYAVLARAGECCRYSDLQKLCVLQTYNVKDGVTRSRHYSNVIALIVLLSMYIHACFEEFNYS